MAFKVISYNLHFGGKAGSENAWRTMLSDFAADVICAQETRDPREYFDPGHELAGCIWRQAPNRRWGSAIVSSRYRLEEIALDGFEGLVVGARVQDLVIGGHPNSLTIFCVHAPSPYLPAVGKILDEIAVKWDGTPMMLAGDFNLTTAARHASESLKNTQGELRLLNRLRTEFGLLNAWQELHPNQCLPQTLRWTNKPLVPYHCDAIFVDVRHRPYLAEAEVMTSGFWDSASDHNPLAITMK